MSINQLLALYLVYYRYLFTLGPGYMITTGVETLRIDGYLTLILLTHRNLAEFYRLTKYVDPLSVRKAYSSFETCSYKCVVGLKTLLVEYLLMQNRHLTGEEKNPKNSDPLGII